MSTTMSKYGASINRPLSEIVGLSTDVKPTDKVEGVPIQNGSTFFEMDTNKKYRFDIESKQWNLVDGGGGGGSATLIDKTITANGTYNASDEGVDGYKKVVVDVDNSAHFSKIRCAISNGSTEVTPFYLYTSSDGEYDVYLQASTYEEAFLASPLTRVTYHDTSSIIFTPSNNFDINTAFKRNDNYSPIASGSATPTAGDGKIYRAECKSWGDYAVTITALTFTNSGSTNFNFSIT